MTSSGNKIVFEPPVVVVGGVVGVVGVPGVAASGVNVTDAEAFKVLLAAVTVTVCWVEMVLGAVYNPVELIVPTIGLIDQVTLGGPLPPIPLELLTVAANCCDFDTVSAT
jgi:hypothetical protein